MANDDSTLVKQTISKGIYHVQLFVSQLIAVDVPEIVHNVSDS